MTHRVLIVDDETLIASSLKAFLEDEELTADFVSSAEEALELLRQPHRYDVCIMDMRLPGMDGSTAIRWIHELAPEMRFIVHTGSVNYIITSELKRLGVMEQHLFHKPLSDMRLIAEAVRALQG